MSPRQCVKTDRSKTPCYFLTIMLMFHCSPDFGHRTIHSSGISPEAAGVATVCQCKVPLTAITDFQFFFLQLHTVSNLEKACFGVNSPHNTIDESSDFGFYDPIFSNSTNIHQASFDSGFEDQSP